MPDPDDLHRLAPHVDNERAAAAFRRRRRQARSYRRGAWAAGAMVLVVGAGALVAANLGNDTPVLTGPAGPREGDGAVTFAVLAMTEGGEEMGTLRAATTTDELAAVWDGASATGVPPAIDFAEQVVVSMTIPDDACPPELSDFTRAGAVITPVFLETATACVDPLIPKTFVVALDRPPLEPGFTLHLSLEPVFGIEDQFLDVALTGEVLAGPAKDPTCEEIERFADQLVDVGITYDYEPSSSPVQLLDDADLVVTGVLTGGFDSRTDEAGIRSAVGYEVFVTTVHKSPETMNITNPLTIWVDINPTLSPDDFQAALAPGAPVVAFAYVLDDGQGFDAGVEGFATGCPGERPLGWVGASGDWPDVASIEDLTQRLDAADGRATVDPPPGVDDPGPTCPEIERFAAGISGNGIFNLRLSESPEALLTESALVLSGNLTGDVERRGSTDRSGSIGYVGYEVAPNAVYKGADDLSGDAAVTIWVPVSPQGGGLIGEDESSIPAGAPVIVFADSLNSNQGWTAFSEGLATACPGEPPIGLTGTARSWTELTSLDDLASRLEVASNE